MDQRVVVIAPTLREHELVLLGLSLLLGLAYLFGAPPPSSVAAQMPSWIVHAWSIGLAVSGAAGILARLLHRRWREAALLVEAGSMLIGAGALAIVATAIIAATGTRGMFGAAFTIAWAVANLIRAFAIRREFRSYQ